MSWEALLLSFSSLLGQQSGTMVGYKTLVKPCFRFLAQQDHLEVLNCRLSNLHEHSTFVAKIAQVISFINWPKLADLFFFLQQVWYVMMQHQAQQVCCQLTCFGNHELTLPAKAMSKSSSRVSHLPAFPPPPPSAVTASQGVVKPLIKGPPPPAPLLLPPCTLIDHKEACG